MKSGRFWIGVVVGLICMSVGIHALLLYKALSDPSFAVEPDYETKAANWDAIQRERRESERLGWQVALRTRPSDEAGWVDVELSVSDRDGQPVSGAEVAYDAFHNARAAEIQHGALPETETGRYSRTLPLHRSGVWEFRLRMSRGDERFIKTVRTSVLSVPRALAGVGG